MSDRSVRVSGRLDYEFREVAVRDAVWSLMQQYNCSCDVAIEMMALEYLEDFIVVREDVQNTESELK